MKKNCRKALSILLCIIMLISTVATGITASAETVKSGTCGENLTWILDDQGTLTISGTGETYNYYNYLIVPWAPLSDTIKEIMLSDGITGIGIYTFYGCTSLYSITIPKSVKSISFGAFGNCPSLTSIIVEEENPVFDSRNNCNAIIDTATNTLIVGCKNTTIPESVIKIWHGAFNGCSSLTDIYIPDNVLNICDSAFIGCSSLTKVDFGKNSQLISIGKGAFQKCSNLLSIVIPESVINIEDDAFYKCSNLSDVIFGDNSQLTSIGEMAFSSCTSLKSVTIPNGVNSIDDWAFAYCTGLVSIKVDEGNTVYDSRNNCNALIETSTNTLIVGCKNSFIPDNIKSIYKFAFKDCAELTTVIIPDSVISIGDYAFNGCSSLENIKISNSIINIGSNAFGDTKYYSDENNWSDGFLYLSDYLLQVKEDVTGSIGIKDGTKIVCGSAFSSCDKIVNVVIPNSVKSIGDKAFHYCDNLITITIPDSVTSIGVDAFAYCENLANVYYSGSEIDAIKIKIDTNNEDLLNATWHYTKPLQINIASEKTVDYKSKVTIKATANNVPEGYFLALYINDNYLSKGTNTEVTYEAGQITSDINYTVKVIDASSTVQNDVNGKELAKDSKITVNASFFKKLIAFFKGLFGLLPIVIIKP